MLESIERVVYRLNLVTGRFEYISGAASSLFGLEPAMVRDAGMELVGRHMLPGDYDAAMTGAALAESISKSLAKKAVAAKVDGQIRDLDRPLTADARFAIVTDKDPDALDLLRVYFSCLHFGDHFGLRFAFHKRFRLRQKVGE